MDFIVNLRMGVELQYKQEFLYDSHRKPLELKVSLG